MMTTDTATTLAKTITGIDISGYLVRDPQTAIAFYREKLGIEPTEVDDEGRGAEFTLADGTTFGVWNMPDNTTGGFVMFAVSDLQDAVKTYRARGVNVSDITETPVCYMAFAQDPEGNGIILHQRKFNG
jgi:predicted enzyme related to lactoylglutathione lyase